MTGVCCIAGLHLTQPELGWGILGFVVRVLEAFRTANVWADPLPPPCMPIRSANCSAAVSANPKSPAASTSAGPRCAASYHRRSVDMATKSNETAREVYQIKITLLGTKPPIWRRLLVPANLTLAQLHDVLQIAMGWDDGHMHEFRVGQRRFGWPVPADRFMRMPRTESERTARLSPVRGRAGATMIYSYDFSDSWEHSIVLAKQPPADPSATYPVCKDGELARPPEGCGDIPGFYDRLDALSDPNHERQEELSDWIGEDFDPQAFSLDLVNRKLEPKRRRASTPND